MFALPGSEGLMLSSSWAPQCRQSLKLCPSQILLLTSHSNGTIILLPIADVLSEYIGYFFWKEKKNYVKLFLQELLRISIWWCHQPQRKTLVLAS